MATMTAGMLDHRNIGSNITLSGDEGDIVSGAIALIVQHAGSTEIHLAYDDAGFEVSKATEVDIALPPAAAYTLGLKNAVEEILTKLNGKPVNGRVG